MSNVSNAVKLKAFFLVLGAGLSTAVGAAVVFVPRLVRFASRRTLAAALGLSAGVMTYVSFVEIFQKSVLSFQDAGFEEGRAYVFSTACFFGGVVFMVTLNYIVTNLLGGGHHHDVDVGKETVRSSATPEANTPRSCPVHSADPGADLEKFKSMAEEINARTEEGNEWNGKEEQEEGSGTRDCGSNQGSSDCEADQHGATPDKDSAAQLMTMSINTAVAIAIHNFPEGLATFVATLADEKVGVVLAIAIAIHNIPEGLCVAMPIYYATGNRWKAFGWALFSGVAEPIAAALGWAILADSFSDKLYALLFGMVAGMMVIISMRELMPTAHRYDPQDSVVTYSFIFGMGIMAVSLVLFQI